MWLVLVLVHGLFLSAPGQEPQPLVRINVVLWFDTEDYILPASDDAAMKVASWLSEQSIRATFKVVGEKARTLERRGRADVIEALKKHEIGYHSNWHSVPPSPAQYLNECGWEDGIAEFTRREKPGFDDVARIFGRVPTCYGQPGSSWAPQTHAALRNWGVKIYLDAGQHVNVEGKPIWYGGLLNFYKLTHQIRVGLRKPEELEEAKKVFLQARERLISEKGGVISIVYHPCEFVHQQFWDGVNFREGANPPREQWKLPPAKTDVESKVAYYNFEQYILFMKRFPEIRFATATEAAQDYFDTTQEKRFTSKEIIGLCATNLDRFAKEGISWAKTDDGYLSAAELFTLVTQALADSSGMEADHQLLTGITGPSQASRGQASVEAMKPEEFSRVAKEVLTYLHERKQIPSVVWVGSRAMRPEDYFWLAMRELATRGTPGAGRDRGPERVRLKSEDYVAEDGPHLWRWVIFPPGFRAPQVMAHARRQAWTLKPATFHPR